MIYALAATGLQGTVSAARLQAHSTSALVCAASALGGPGRAKGWQHSNASADARRGASVDVELVALGVPQRDRVVVKALLEFLPQAAEQRGAEVAQPPGLGVRALLAGLDREVPPAAG